MRLNKNNKQTAIAIVLTMGIVAALFGGCGQRPAQQSGRSAQAAMGTTPAAVWQPKQTTNKSVAATPRNKHIQQGATLAPVTHSLAVHPGRLTAYLGSPSKGIVGLYDGNQTDNPADNIFSIKLDCQPTANDKVWLTYRLAGVTDNSGVACSINDRLAFGGYLVKKDTATKRQRIQLNALWLQKGDNRIQFGLAENANYGYRVSDLAIEVEQGVNDMPLAVTSSHTLYNGKAYIHGFVQASGKTNVSIDGKAVAVRDGEFETIISPNDKQEAEVTAQLNGRIYTKALRFENDVQADTAYALSESPVRINKTFEKGKINELKTPDVFLKTDNKGLLTTKNISLTALRPIDLPAMDLGMTNVTADKKGFRFLPHGEHFTQTGATVALKYDRTKIPDGYTENDIRSYYFDPNTKHWVALERDTVDRTLCMVVSKTTHFTDMINGVIKTPESPQTEGFAPTMMNGIQPADPTSKIEMIAPPSANNQGSANLSYPLELPPARNGMSPQLAIQYNSDGGSGWLGEGWDLNIPSIAVDTRWGVPRYDPSYETETYNMNGTMLATAVNDTLTQDSVCSVSIAHRGVMFTRLKNRQFHPKVESDFSRIIRYGDKTDNYYWIVTDKNGTKYTYGGNGATLSGLITTVNGATKNVIAEWKLSRIEEAHGDYVNYFYTAGNPVVAGTVNSKSLVLYKIETGNGSIVSQQILFTSDSIKHVKINNGRYGFLTSSNSLLTKIDIKIKINAKFEPVRSYGFRYRTGAFNKSLLEQIIHNDSAGHEIDKHTLDYFDNITNSSQSLYNEPSKFWDLNYRPYANLFGINLSIPEVVHGVIGSNPLDLTNRMPALGGGETSAFGGSLYIGVGLNDGRTSSKSCTVGYNTSASTSTTNKISTLVDINGDGLIDKIYQSNHELYFCPNMGGNTFGSPIKINNSPDKFFKTTSNTTTSGWQGNLSFDIGSVGAGLNFGTDKSETNTYTSTYFADVNNDGLVDIVCDRTVYFNKIEYRSNGIAVPTFTLKSSETSNPIYDIQTPKAASLFLPAPAPLVRDTSFVEKEKRKLLASSPMQDVVRVWQAPYSGEVEISGTAVFVSPVGDAGYDADKYSLADGVQLTIETSGNILNTYTLSKSTVNSGGSSVTTHIGTLSVTNGQRIYFRVKSGSNLDSNGDYDKVSWSPVITYTDQHKYLHTVQSTGYDVYDDSKNIQDYNQLENTYYDNSSGNNTSYSGVYNSNQTLINKIGYNLIDPNISTFSISGNFYKPVTTDAITVKIHLANDSVITKDTIVSDYFEPDSLGNGRDTLISYNTVNPNYKDSIIFSRVIRGSDEATSIIDLNTRYYTTDYNSFTVQNSFGGSYLRFEICAESNIRWDKINWKPEIHYTVGDRDTVVYAGVKHSFYDTQGSSRIKYSDIRQKTIITPIFNSYLFSGRSGSMYMVVKGTDNNNNVQLLGKKRVKIVNGVIQGQKANFLTAIQSDGNSNNSQWDISDSKYDYTALQNFFTSNTNSDNGSIADYSQMHYDNTSYMSFCIDENYLSKIWIEYYSDDESLTQAIMGGGELQVKILTWNSAGNGTPVGSYWNPVRLTNKSVPIFMKQSNWDFGAMWQGWGAFQYNASNGRWNKPIDEGSLHLPNSAAETSIDQMAFICLYPDGLTKSYWRGTNDNIYLKDDLISVGRLNIQNMTDLSALTGGSNSPLRVKSSDPISDEINNAPVLSTKYDSRSYWGGGSVNLGTGGFSAGLSGSTASGTGATTMGFMDMNGDGYPDRITDNRIEYSNSRGGRDGEITSITPEQSSSNVWSVGLDGSFTHAIPVESSSSAKDNGKSNISINLAKADYHLGASVAYSENTDCSSNTYADINGDGLPDRIYEDNGIKACLNLGYSFSSPIDLGIRYKQGGKNTGWNFGIGGGTGADFLGNIKGLGNFNLGIGLGLGIGGAVSTSVTLHSYMDMNGDGLTDELYVDANDNFYIAYNVGNGFTAPIQCTKSSIIQKSFSSTLSANANATLGVGYLFLKAVVSGGLNFSHTIDKTLTQIQDIDGDGLPDILTSQSNSNNIQVLRSTVGCTNKLKSVLNPIGGTFSIDYGRSKATTEHPSGKWVLKSVIVDDGVNDDGPVTKNTYEYSGGKYDRHEREFIGFANVIAKNIDTEKGDTVANRIITQVFDTTSNYVRNNLLRTIVANSSNTKYNENQTEYYVYKVSRMKKSGGYKTWPDTYDDQSIVYTPVKYTKAISYEGTRDSIITENYSEYNIAGGNHGEVKLYRYSDKGSMGNAGTGNYNYQTEIDYTSSNDTTHYVYGLPKKVVVKGSDNKVYRQVRAEWDTNYPNHLCYMYQQLGNGDSTITKIVYDNWGNIRKKYLPKNSSGQRMMYSYTYDPDAQYITQVTDTFGYTTKFGDYNYKYGIPCKKTDENGNVMLTKLDNLGRVTAITGPNEVGTGKTTMTFSYSPTAKSSSGKPMPFAATNHYDPANTGNTITTITIVDGFGRVIQVKKDIYIDGQRKLLVSGRVNYDAFGRPVKAYYPTVNTYGPDVPMFIKTPDTMTPTMTTYDVLDRPLMTVLPDGTSTNIAYAIDTIKGINYMKATVTDALNHSQVTYANGSGKTVRAVQYHNGKALITSFHYDAIEHPDTVTDPVGKKTISVYDLGGRRTQVTHPATGTTQFGYDAAGNMLWKFTANKDTIRYGYNFGRLESVTYPKHPENNVKFTFGDKNASNNRKGRLVSQEDGSGAQEFWYGKQGELTKVRRTLIVPNQAVASYVTKWQYDSWNRLQKMTYPDGEEISYGYNVGGQLNRVSNNQSYTYVSNITYDKFGERQQMTYGNGAVTNYSYNDSTRNLKTLSVTGAGSKVFMNNLYAFDKVRNVRSISNLSVATENGIGGATNHSYGYDDLYRLTSANGTFAGEGTKSAGYNMTMDYDDMYNPISKQLKLKQYGIQFNDSLNTGYNLLYTMANNSQQIANIAETSYRTERMANKQETANTHQYSYDANGNLLSVLTGTKQGDKLLATNSRKMLWDEDNHLLSVSDNGFVSNYWYDASGERTVKETGDGEGVLVNGAVSAARTGTSNYTVYVNPYTVINNGGQMSKHIYVGGERILSKLCDAGSMADPTKDTTACAKNFTAKYADLTGRVKTRFDSLGVAYFGKDNAGKVYYKTATGTNPVSLYYYHSDHLGSASLITDGAGHLNQHLAYIPNGEVFVNQQLTSFDSRYKFSGKEMDEETGLYYSIQRYLDPKGVGFLSVDPLAEDYPNVSSYVYCHDNPVNMTDPDGRGDFYTNKGVWQGSDGKKDNLAYTASSVTKDKNGLVTGAEDQNKLKFTNSELVKLAAVAYSESDAKSNTKEEQFGIASASMNNYNVRSGKGKKDLSSVLSEISCATHDGNENYQKFNETSSEDRNDNAKMVNSTGAAINAMTGGVDYSNGATSWDGRDLKTNSHRSGLNIADPKHDIFKVGDKPYKDPSKHNNSPYSRQTTAAYGKTVFERIHPKFIKGGGRKW